MLGYAAVGKQGSREAKWGGAPDMLCFLQRMTFACNGTCWKYVLGTSCVLKFYGFAICPRSAGALSSQSITVLMLAPAPESLRCSLRACTSNIRYWLTSLSLALSLSLSLYIFLSPSLSLSLSVSLSLSLCLSLALSSSCKYRIQVTEAED